MSDPPPHPPTLCPGYYYEQLSFPKCFLCLGFSFYFPSHTLLSYQLSRNAASNVLCPKLSVPPDCLKLSLSLLCYLSHQTLLPHFWLLTVQKLHTSGKSGSTLGRSSLVCSRAVLPAILGPHPCYGSLIYSRGPAHKQPSSLNDHVAQAGIIAPCGTPESHTNTLSSRDSKSVFALWN